MSAFPSSWRNRSPGDLSIELNEVCADDVASTIEAACNAAPAWRCAPLVEKIARMKAVQQELANAKERLARGISLETGKPLNESLGEVGAVIAKIDLTIEDAKRYLAEECQFSGPHAATVRRRARGPAAVIAPFNFPLHLGHGANVAHLLAGNPVIFKPSPLCANVAADYGAIMASAFPSGTFSVLQGGGAEGEALCMDARVRSVCFTGSTTVGQALATALAHDFSKDLALELGGVNAAIVCSDADLDRAAAAAAEGACLTTGQRCNATSRVIVEKSVAPEFERKFLESLAAYQPGDPLSHTTKLGPLISAGAVARYESRCAALSGDWLQPGKTEPEVGGKRGHFVRPAVIRRNDDGRDDAECFVPIVSIFVVDDLDHALRIHNATPYGLTASVFTRSEAKFRTLGEHLDVGNLYANLPTTFSPSTLPFGGLRNSGNGRPGGRGFIRFTTDEQAVQWTGFDVI